MIVNVLFYVFGAILVLCALGVITARNPVHCALFLVAAFLNSAVIWLLLQAEFLALTLIVVYVGAVMVLWLFVVMMLDIDLAVHPLCTARRADRADRRGPDRPGRLRAQAGPG
jgi:NADH-quinone oxidoreductase subunit J